MKKKNLATLLIFTICITFTACSSSKEPESQKSASLTKDEVQQMIDNNNDSLKSELLSETASIIDAKIKDIKISNAEKEDLKQAIIASIESNFDQNKGTTIIRQEPDQYITNVTEEYITNGNEEPTNNSETDSPVPPLIEDGLEIPLSFELPYNYVFEDELTFTIETATFQAYNHENEPYREIPYPYEIKYDVTGSIINHNPNSYLGTSGSLIPFSFEPYGTIINSSGMKIDYENNTFTYTGSITVNIIPDSIGLNE